MRDAEAKLQALIDSSTPRPAPVSVAAGGSPPPPPFSCFLQPLEAVQRLTNPYTHHADDAIYDKLHGGIAHRHRPYDISSRKRPFGIACPTRPDETTSQTWHHDISSHTWPQTGLNVPTLLDMDSSFLSLNQCRDLVSEEEEKTRSRQQKADLRKQRNKEAARRSNLNKKRMKEELEQKSLELREQNLQLQQDIQMLNHQLQHFRHMRNVMHHACRSRMSATVTAF